MIATGIVGVQPVSRDLTYKEILAILDEFDLQMIKILCRDHPTWHR